MRVPFVFKDSFALDTPSIFVNVLLINNFPDFFLRHFAKFLVNGFSPKLAVPFIVAFPSFIKCCRFVNCSCSEESKVNLIKRNLSSFLKINYSWFAWGLNQLSNFFISRNTFTFVSFLSSSMISTLVLYL
jgi:hypothetical protein